MPETTGQETPQPETLSQKVGEEALGIITLERLDQEYQIRRQNRMLERLARIQQDAYAQRVGVEIGGDENMPEPDDSEDRNVHIGDEFKEIHHHNDQPGQSPPSIIPWIVGGILAVIAALVLLACALMLSRPSNPSLDTDTKYQLDGDWEPGR